MYPPGAGFHTDNHKSWITPAGELHGAVRYNERWPHGLDIPLYNDFNAAHFVRPWVENYHDLECLRYVLLPPQNDEFYTFVKKEFEKSKSIADEFEIATMEFIASGLSGGMHMFGPEPLCMATVMEPDLVDAYLELEHEKNLRHIELALELGVDIIARNGFFETADAFSPEMLNQFVSKRAQKEFDLIHQAGKATAYFLLTGVMPILDHVDSLNFDCVLCIDSAFEGVDLNVVRENLHDKKSFWTGPSNTFNLWDKDSDSTRQVVRNCFEILGKEGLILGCAPSLHSIMPWSNFLAMVEEWKQLR